MNFKLKFHLLKEKIRRLNPIYADEPIRISCSKHTRLTLDLNGCIVNAEGLNLIMWFNVYEDINKKILGMNINQFIDLLKVSGTSIDNIKSLESLIHEYYQFGILNDNSENLEKRQIKNLNNYR